MAAEVRPIREEVVNADDKDGVKTILVTPTEKYVAPKGTSKKKVIDEFHKLYYAAAFEEGMTWMRTEWGGVPMGKMPNDLLNLANLIWKIKPALIIETGTDCGGSALFMASYMDLLGHGKVLSVDIKPFDRAYPNHPRISYLSGKSSVAPDVVTEIKGWVAYYEGPVMLILDSDHSEEHVTAELDALAGFVTPGSYLIVEDENVNGHPVLLEHGPGPFEATEKWMPEHPEFQKDVHTASTHLFTMHGWYRRLRG